MGIFQIPASGGGDFLKSLVEGVISMCFRTMQSINPDFSRSLLHETPYGNPTAIPCSKQRSLSISRSLQGMTGGFQRRNDLENVFVAPFPTSWCLSRFSNFLSFDFDVV